MQLFCVLLYLSALSHYARSQDETTAGPMTPEEKIEQLQSIAQQLGRQLMLQQLYVEEKTRSEGDSGIKQVRLRKAGTKTYNHATHTSRSMVAIHDHTDNIRTCGMGEFIGVLNGVEFRTRHNDYKLRMPSTNSSDYHLTEDIPFPDVPPEVLEKATVAEQIAEMREWFRAWKNSNRTHRDYRPYFRTNLCYLEGAWTNDRDLDEPFDSDRHQLEADSWFDLQEKIRFTSYTGDKDPDENFAYLPTTIMEVNDGIPVFGQWNYRILCHPVKGNMDLTELEPLDDLGVRLTDTTTYEEYLMTRKARFQLRQFEQNRMDKYGRLDELMQQVPGKDNYPADITDELFGNTKFEVENNRPLNVGYYHRWYRMRQEGAMGEKVARRGYADRNLFVAETNHTRVAPISVTSCKKKPNGNKVCKTYHKRITYAIPLEVVFTTPLNSWNPFDIEYKGSKKSDLGKTVTANGRNGRHDPDKAFNGTNNVNYYLTPVNFFTGGEIDSDSADTVRKSVGVLDRNGVVRSMKPSGMRIFLPEIEGVGVLRTRFPIAPIYAEGSSIWKELEALRDVVMNMQKFHKYFESDPGINVTYTEPDTSGGDGDSTDVITVLATSPSNPDPVGLHSHIVELTPRQYKRLVKRGKVVTARTSEENGHSHELEIKYDKASQTFRMVTCDKQAMCWDGHLKEMTLETQNLSGV